ncbi:isoleucine biosynthesis transcriptional activator [Oxalicibacterium flavum]|uniref:Isoleucine biosynthesis transcriptional activator n=1 Tax=Oxalicibacterium flavum TaxID=179467 RepID=A0A8J2UMT7_9BURK|nr:LysR substrate-binding domain-containing protein [Oxalicibacterium flavum]GGC09135.1 isoleucine biosynthesis transcriptional activator [Oxalicibacterium flavum]
MNIELRQLRYFVTVAEEMHFGRAAQRLHMTQPPLSLAIRSLENALGTALFRRNSRSVALTPAGAALLPEAQRILQQTAALPDLLRRAASGASGSLSLAFVSTADYSVLPSFLREFRETYPAVEIDLREATTDVQIEELTQGRIDVGLLIPPLPEKARLEIDYLPVLSEPLILAAPKGLQALRGKARADLALLTELPLIVFPRRIAPALHDAILACYHEAGLTPRIGQEAIQMQTIIGLVSAGMGIALVPQSVSNLKRPGVDYRPLTNRTPMVETGLAWRRDNASPVLHAFLELLRKK